MLTDQELDPPDKPLLTPCSDWSPLGPFLVLNVQFREQECDFGRQNSANSLYFSLLAGDFGGEELAPDLPLSSTSWHTPQEGLDRVILD